MRDTSWTATGMRCRARELESASAASTSSLSSCSFISSSARYLRASAAVPYEQNLRTAVLHEVLRRYVFMSDLPGSKVQLAVAPVPCHRAPLRAVLWHDLVQVELRTLARRRRGGGGATDRSVSPSGAA